jgi:putative glutamine amidotransferase
LIQHIPGHKLTHHSIRVLPSSRLFHITGLTEYQVVSRHHQAIDNLADSLEAIAWSTTDGFVEAVERPGSQFVVGVQWHPEDCYLTNDPDARLFAAFREALVVR